MDTMEDELAAESMARELLATGVGGIVRRYALAVLQEVSAHRLERIAFALDGGTGDSVQAARDRCAAAMIHVEYRMVREEMFRLLAAPLWPDAPAPNGASGRPGGRERAAAGDAA